MATHPSKTTSQNTSTRDRRSSRSLVDQYSRPPADRASACEDRIYPAPAWHPGGGRDPTAPLRRAGAEESGGAGPRKPDGPVSQIPRAVAGSSSSLPARGSPSRSLSSDSERGPRSERGPMPRQPSSFTGRLGQPPRGPLSLHMYSRKNVFLQHSLHTAELQALAQQDG
ncbi:hypothetical protein AGOR_G00047890 [Albula goreensis]|uniref:Uncharacterized protein n=1 Tax=Albula goreensis TaxID=1534307 RepID=A0A8T3DSZ8_9TELE|nr:hypothetical protein AGOR_G00047890 [Albula goreensis]